MIGFNQAWVKLLKGIKKSKDLGRRNKLQLWRDTGISYSHIEDLIIEMKKLGFIHCRKDGRELNITLTRKGLALRQKILNIEANGYFKQSNADILT